VIVMLTFDNATDIERGDSVGKKELGVIMFLVYLFVQSFTLALETRSFTWPQHVSIWGLLCGTISLYALVNSSNKFAGFVDYYTFFEAMALPQTYFVILLTVMVVMLPVVVFKYWQLNYKPSPVDLARSARGGVTGGVPLVSLLAGASGKKPGVKNRTDGRSSSDEELLQGADTL